MKFSGYNFRNFINQTGNFDIEWELSFNNISGSGAFGISGNKNFEYKIISGEIYDPYNSILISYTPNQTISLKHSIVNGKDTFYINNDLKHFFKPSNFFNNHNYNYFYFHTDDLVIDSKFFVRGESTKLTASILNDRFGDDNIVSYQNNITGVLVNENTGLEVKIFNGFVNNYFRPYFVTGITNTFNKSGYFTISVDTGRLPFYNGIENIPIIFNTNFGDVSFLAQIRNEYIPIHFNTVNINPNEEIQTIANNTTKNFFIKYGSSTGSFLSIELNHISGQTGFYTGNIPASGYIVDTLSGYITGSGFLTKEIADITLTGFNTYSGILETKELETLQISKFSYATGSGILNYEITGYGYGTGRVFENIPASGYGEIEVSGFVPYSKSISLLFTGKEVRATGETVDISGNPFEIVGRIRQAENYILATYSGDIDNVILVGDQYFSKVFTGEHADGYQGQEILGPKYIELATGYGKGYSKTGIINADFYRFFEPGYYHIWKDVKNYPGYIFLSDSAKLLTGLSGLLTCQFTEEPISYSGKSQLQGTNYIRTFMDDCDQRSPFFYTKATGNPSNEIKLYVQVNKDDQGVSIFEEDSSVKKFLVIQVSGYESGLSNLENINYLTGSPDGQRIRTRISHIGNTTSGSGYFQDLFSKLDCGELDGIWEHNFGSSQIKTQEFISNNYISNINSKILVSEDRKMQSNNYFTFNIISNRVNNLCDNIFYPPLP